MGLSKNLESIDGALLRTRIILMVLVFAYPLSGFVFLTINQRTQIHYSLIVLQSFLTLICFLSTFSIAKFRERHEVVLFLATVIGMLTVTFDSNISHASTEFILDYGAALILFQSLLGKKEYVVIHGVFSLLSYVGFILLGGLPLFSSATIFIVFVTVIILYVGIIRIKNQQELQESKAAFMTLFEESPDGLFLIDHDVHCIIHMNTAGRQLMQRCVLDSSVQYTPLRGDRYKEMIHEVEIHASYETSYQIETVDNKKVWYQLHAKSLLFHQKQCILLRFSNIASLKETEAMIEQQNEELKKMNTAMVNRETKMIALKQELEALKKEKYQGH